MYNFRERRVRCLTQLLNSSEIYQARYINTEIRKYGNTEIIYMCTHANPAAATPVSQSLNRTESLAPHTGCKFACAARFKSKLELDY